MTNTGILGFLAGYIIGRAVDLGVPQFALERRLPNDRKAEAGKRFEDGRGCVPVFLCVCWKRVCAPCWCGMKRRAYTAVSPVGDTGGVHSEINGCVFVWVLAWSS